MKQLKLSNASWLALRFVAFPLVALLPFFLVRWTGAHCFSYTQGRVHTQGLAINGGPEILGILLWVVIGIFLVATFAQGGSRKYHQQRVFVGKQLIVSLVSIVLTFPAYFLLRQHSQSKFVPNWACDSSNHLTGSAAPHGLIGLGFTPSVAIAMAVLYIAVPVIKYYMARVSGKHVAGINKHDLFQ